MISTAGRPILLSRSVRTRVGLELARCTYKVVWSRALSGAGVGMGEARDISAYFFLHRLDKIFRFFELRGMGMGAWRQNIGTKGLIGKILRNKELAGVGRLCLTTGFPLAGMDAVRTVPLCAFCILGQGCSSQELGIFLWKVVEKVRTC
jgi:hypothetical protein